MADLTTNLLDLPDELICHIFGQVDEVIGITSAIEYAKPGETRKKTTHILTARLLNKRIAAATLPYFGRRFFRKKGYMLTSAGLERLKQISTHKELRKYVQHVWFNPDCYTFVSFKAAEESEVAAQRRSHFQRDYLVTAEQYAYAQECLRDHLSLLDSGRFMEELTSAFSTSPNLATLGMRRGWKYGAFGWKQLNEAIGLDPRGLARIPTEESTDLSDATKMFIGMMHALAASSAKIRRLYTDAIEIDHILPEILPQRILDSACKSVLYVEINSQRSNFASHNLKTQIYNCQHEPSEFGVNMARFLGASCKVREISLQILGRRQVFQDVTGLHKWTRQNSYASLSRLASNCTFNHLTRVKLANMVTTSSMLQSILQPSAQTLTSLKLHEFRLLSSPEAPRSWKPFFKFLLSCRSLEFLFLSILLHDHGLVCWGSEPLSDTDTSEFASDDANFGDEDFVSTHQLKESGRQYVRARLEILVLQHNYISNSALSDFDEDPDWHTDTSEEDV